MQTNISISLALEELEFLSAHEHQPYDALTCQLLVVSDESWKIYPDVTIGVAMLQEVHAHEGSDNVAVVDYSKMWTMVGTFLAAGDQVRDSLPQYVTPEISAPSDITGHRRFRYYWTQKVQKIVEFTPRLTFSTRSAPHSPPRVDHGTCLREREHVSHFPLLGCIGNPDSLYVNSACWHLTPACDGAGVLVGVDLRNRCSCHAGRRR